MVALSDNLQLGVYTRQQAAYLARLRPQTLSRWFDEDTGRGPAVRRQIPDDGTGVVSFVDLVQLMAVRSIRLARAISLQKIREATSKAEEMGFVFPLALRGTKVFLLGETVVLQFADGSMLEATGKYAKHYVMEPVVLPYLEGLNFNDEGLPNEYRPKVAAGVLLSPSRQWGAPIIERNNYTVATLVAAVRSEGSIEAAADMCDVPIEDIYTALRFEDFLSGAA